MNRIIMIALVLIGWTRAWAGDVTVIVNPNASAGTVVASEAQAGQTCTLTVTPAAGYYLTKDNLTAVTVVSGEALQSPRRGIDIKSEPVAITATNAQADPSGVTTYTFTMPEDGNIGVEVTAEFQTRKTLTDDMVTLSAESFTYDGIGHQPEVTVKDGEKVLTADTDYELANEGGTNIGSYDVTVTGKGNYTGTITKKFSIVALKYGLTINSVEVTNGNCDDVLGDGSVRFDGRNQLVLNNYKVTGSAFNSIEVSMDALAIYLIGENEVAALTPRDGNTKLTFTTDGNGPGQLTLQEPDDLKDFAEVNYEQNLALYDNEIKVYVEPIVKESGEEKTVDVGKVTLPDEPIVSAVVGEILYTMDRSNGDGVNNNTLELGSGMTPEEVLDVIKNCLPGSPKYLESFSGLTFMIPAGIGTIEIEAKTGSDGVLAVQIGDDDPIYIKNSRDFEKHRIHFARQIANYVRIYNMFNKEHFAPGKAGKKTSTTVGIRTVGVKVKNVQASNSPASSSTPQNETKSTDEVNELVKTTDADGNLTLSDDVAASVVVLPENMLAEEPYSPSVDLRNTNVTGVFVSRTTGVFNNVSKNTFIFMPVGNNTDEPNVIIGSICQFAQLDGNMKDEEQFAPIDEFVAQRAELTTSFEQGQLATVYLPFAITAAEAAGWGTFYTFNGIERGYVKIKEATGDLEPNVPYLFKSAEDGTKIATGVVDIVLPKSNSAQRRTDGDKLVGSYSTQTAADGMYLLRSEGSDFKFEQMQAGEKIKPFQAYLKLDDTSTTVLKVTDNEEVPTGIVSVKSETEAENWTTVSGMTLDRKPQTKGVYIHNGKKIVVR